MILVPKYNLFFINFEKPKHNIKAYTYNNIILDFTLILFSSEDQNEDSDQEDDDELPIEKESRKLKKKQEKEAKEAEDELKINVDDKETFQLPSGQEIEQEKSRKYLLFTIKKKKK